MMHTLQAQVCGCISAHPGLPHQKTKRETNDASKSKLNQASWNKTVLKFVSENQIKGRNFFQSFFVIFPWKLDLDKITSLSVQLGVRRTPRVKGVRLSLIFHTCAKEIKCFRILFACWFVDLLQIPRNEYASKFQGTLQMGQKAIIRFCWESGLIVSMQKPYHHFLETFRSISMFKVVFRDSSLYPKQSRAYAREGGWGYPPLSLIFYENFITPTKEID